MAADDKSPKGVMEMGYETTLMYGSYSRQSLAEYAKTQAKVLRQSDQEKPTTRIGANKKRNQKPKTSYEKWIHQTGRFLAFLWSQTFAKVGEDWVFLALLGVIMALISFTMDYGIYMCNSARLWMYEEITVHDSVRYLAWIILPVFLVLFASGFVFIVAPQAVGSGIPEMKTIMRGVVLKEYLTFRTLIAKTIGLTAALGSGMPLGKEGPLVHIGSIVGTLLSKLLTSFKGIYENESRNNDMLAAACAVGVSCSLGAPIGGVLFSIEVTSVYFAIRNYWRGFFSAVFSALMFRLLAYWVHSEDTLTAVYPTSFHADFPYDPHELFVFTLIGVFGGLSGALFVLMHRRYVLFMRNNKRISSFLKYNRFIYPTLVAVFIGSMLFPLGFGRFLATTLTNKQQIGALFANFTWMSNDLTVEQADLLSHWNAEDTNLFVSLGIFTLSTFLFNMVASTLPVPTGSLIPIFKVGAAFGRMVGEAMHLWFPEGIRSGSVISPILPGGYAIVGAAAFSAGVTHTVSICVVVSEMTGQIHHIIPILVAVLVSNAISTLLQPSLYESIIMIKKLPYLPSILPSRSAAHSVSAKDFMNRDIKYIWNGITYRELENILDENQDIRSYPLLDNPKHMVLLGSVQRIEMMRLLEHHIGRDRRLEIATKRRINAKLKEEKERKRAELLLLAAKPEPIPSPPIVQQLVEPVQTMQQESSMPTIRKVSRFQVITSPNTAISGVCESEQPVTGGAEPVTESLTATNPPLPCSVTQITVVSDDPIENIDLKPQRPIKSILKRTNSFTMIHGERARHLSSSNLPVTSSYSTVTGAEGRKFRQVLDALLGKQSTTEQGEKLSFLNSMTSMPMISPTFKKSHGGTRLKEQWFDMSTEEQEIWEEKEIHKPVDFKKCIIDPAPFQLVERTSLVKVHSIFSLLGVHHAYVTTLGKLVGIVSLKELRKAIEDVNAGKLIGTNDEKCSDTSNDSTDDGSDEDSELGNQSAKLDSDVPTATCRHVQFKTPRVPSVSLISENEKTTV